MSGKKSHITLLSNKLTTRYDNIYHCLYFNFCIKSYHICFTLFPGDCMSISTKQFTHQTTMRREAETRLKSGTTPPTHGWTDGRPVRTDYQCFIIWPVNPQPSAMHSSCYTSCKFTKLNWIYSMSKLNRTGTSLPKNWHVMLSFMRLPQLDTSSLILKAELLKAIRLVPIVPS